MGDLAAEFFKQPQLPRQSDPPPWLRANEEGAGMPGEDGPQGDRGDQGPQGFQGALGANGTQGSQGAAGVSGAAGTQGLTGFRGVQGGDGPAGDAGDAGDQGPQGDTGPQGAQGAQGVPGDPGNDATKGAIVAASGGPEGRPYVRLFCAEAPEVWFFDFVRIPAGEHRWAEVDPLFVEVCEPGSLFAQTTAGPYKAFLSDDQRRVYVPDTIEAAVVTIYGIRRGFAGVRFTRHTAEQNAENNRFWNEQFTA